MDQIKDIFNRLNRKDHDDDTVDRMNYATTTKLLSFFAALILAKQAVGDALQCFIPAEYKTPWEKYIETYCFVENTYFVNASLTQFPAYSEDRRAYELKYYQWMPYIFVLEAIICYSPKLLFKILYSFAETRVTDIIQYAWQEVRKAKKAGKVEQLEKQVPVSQLIAERLVALRPHPSKVTFGWYLTAIYFGMKFMALITIMLQLFLLQFFIDAQTPFWGFGLISDLYNGRDWRVNGYFPRVTFCDLKTRDLGQQRPHTIQCVLMLNMFIEKIYLFLWAWFLLSFAVTTINIIYWAFRVFNRGRKISMINDALIQSDEEQPEVWEIENFIRSRLRNDGIVVLRLIDSNFGYINMTEVCTQLWKNHKPTKQE